MFLQNPCPLNSGNRCRSIALYCKGTVVVIQNHFSTDGLNGIHLTFCTQDFCNATIFPYENPIIGSHIYLLAHFYCCITRAFQTHAVIHERKGRQ